jgi:DNA adenine methylase
MPRQSVGSAPFLKWAGGKSKLLDAILHKLPKAIDHYFEPFLGGGALFFALANDGRFRRAVLCDRNADLVDTYLAVRDDVEEVIRHLREHRHDEGHFYRVRALDPAALPLAERAARTIYLNRTCYNGLYRVNRAGRFNVPFGRYESPRICDAAGLRRASEALQAAEILCADFEAVVAGARPGDAVYFDPPYFPISATSSFTAYDPYPFGEREHCRLARVHRALASRGVASVLSNSDCAFTRELFAGLRVETVHAARAINSVAKRRGKVSELLVLGPAV